MTIIVEITKEKIIKALDIVVCALSVILALSLILSFFNTMTNRPCKTYGYYLPLTFVMCNINSNRPGVDE